jgi:hypothetical protein
MEKEFGGLGVPNLRELNLCLLGSWVRRYFVDNEKIWKQLIDFKYKLLAPTSLPVERMVHPISEKVSYGLQKWLKWGIGED